uniref:Tyr recombinase domain-containing protein n=1 Tax=Amphimedon queenslandica TaxID=400682 RepID=A0A1X7TEK2_AMPQE
MASRGLSYGSIRVYLSGVRFVQIIQGLPDLAVSSLPRLDYVLKGICRSVPSRSRRQHLPITPEILRLLFQAWSHQPITFDAVLFWATCCVGEFACPSWGAFTNSMLSFGDVSVDSHSSPTYISLLHCQSKTDVFGAGVRIDLIRVDGPICPVMSLLSYLAMRGSQSGPLFQFKNGSPLSRRRLVGAVHESLALTGLDVSRFNRHSFQIGATTTAAACGIEDLLNQTLVRWKSSAFTRYILTPRSTLVRVSQSLLSC